jgi:hypothetical protein
VDGRRTCLAAPNFANLPPLKGKAAKKSELAQ